MSKMNAQQTQTYGSTVKVFLEASKAIIVSATKQSEKKSKIWSDLVLGT